ncbi:unnamed protein product [Orchesella dallaii]|uniref:Carboxypeptidase Q n=1 Tax=Orchesella dallaii TaxID=48710 RepID=A0ABP1QVR2_9HEXA
MGSYLNFPIFIILASLLNPNIHVSGDSQPEILNIEQYLQDSPSANTRFFGGRNFNTSECTSLSPEIRSEIEDYREVVYRILETTLTGHFQGKTYDDLATFVDKFGPRVSGSDALEESITYLGQLMTEADMEDVHEEEAVTPMWLRGNESAILLSPRKESLDIRGLGFSVPTPDEGITGEVVLVRSFKEMQAMKESLAGKIVVYNSKTGEGPLHCIIGASMAAKMGAIAALARSATSYSLYSVHASVQFYDEKIPKIPVAALTLEDADMIERMLLRGENVTIHLTMTNTASSERMSRNVIGDYKGRELPEEYVMLAGHSDSWDMGEGALDDGIGPILAIEVINLLRFLNLTPRRTIRNAFFTGEEAGLYGARRYVSDHRSELDSYSAALEADFGCLRASGLLFSGSTKATCIIHEIMQLYSQMTNATSLIRVGGVPTDIYLMNRGGVPGIVLNGDDGRYFWYHHTDADTMTAMQPANLDRCLAVWASTAYIIADLNEKLPRD